MGIPVLILGESGSGKSTSLRNFEPNELVIYNVAGKPLPFRKGAKMNRADNATYSVIRQNMGRKRFKRYVIDDSQYLLCFELFDRSAETGYTKFTEMANHFYSLIKFVIKEMPADTIVYFLHHIEQQDGKVKAKTIGKMLDEKLTVEGLFSIVLMAINKDGEHLFLTQSDGTNTVKTPLEMFEKEEIDNDLKLVDTTIRKYYEIEVNNNESI
ncbi:AAA family ATPase [Candidatus Pseudoruminococcus sp.]|uniref:AAA family ATPase n=1 Tax=Candidatus Pseudoruminococcus sp. TaxID=3101048 RepID=UPI00399BB682